MTEENGNPPAISRNSRRNLLIAAIVAVPGVALTTFVTQCTQRATDDVYDWAKKELPKYMATNFERLKISFPSGFAIFAITDARIVDDKRAVYGDITIDWSSAKVIEVTAEKITFRMPTAVIDGTVRLENNIESGANRVGRWPPQMSINGWNSRVEILMSNPKAIFAVIGYEHVENE